LKGDKIMKLNFTVEIDRDNDIYNLEEEILNKAAESLIGEILGNAWDKTDLYTKFEKRVVEKLEALMDVDFKNEVAKKVTENLSNKFEKTKQYKALKADGAVVSDALIKTGLKDLVGEIVKSEMKKVFR